MIYRIKDGTLVYGHLIAFSFNIQFDLSGRINIRSKYFINKLSQPP